MMMVLTHRHSLQPPVTGGCTNSIFPQVETWLNEDSDRVNALEFVASRKDMGRYQSVVDFIFVEMHPSMRRACFAHYEDRGKALRQLIDEPQRSRYEQRMLALLGVAYEAFNEKRRLSWSGTVKAAELRLAA